jgi:serine phosphatase RsbU (regulator of sigma subunit)
VADVTGHGIGPALVAAEARALLRALAEDLDDVSSILARTNHWLCADLPESRFVTIFFGILDPLAHRLDFTSAGHGPLLWYNACRREVTSMGATGPPVGLMDPMVFPQGEPVTFAPGDMGIFLTDGFLEAQDRSGTQFGEKRMDELIVRHAERPAAELIQVMKTEVEEHIDGQRQLDDFTAVIVKRCR